LLRKGSALLADFGAAPSRALGIEGPQASQSGPEQFARAIATDPTLPYSIGLGGLGAVARPAVGMLKNLKRGLGFGATEGALASGVDYGRTGEANLGTNIGLGLLGGGLSGGMEAGRVRLADKEPVPIAQTQPSAAPKPVKVNPDASFMEQGQQKVAQNMQEAEALTPEWIGPMGLTEQWGQLPSQLKRAVILTEKKPEYKNFYFEMDAASKKQKAGGKDVFKTLAETKGKEAFDAYQKNLETVGNRVKAVRNEYIPQAMDFTSFDEFGQGLGLEDVMQMTKDANGVPKVTFLDASNNFKTLSTGKLTAGQKLLKNFFDGDSDVTVPLLKRFRDKTFKDKIKGKKEVDASIMEVYNGANKLLDSKIEESIRVNAPMGSNIFEQFQKDKKAFAKFAQGEVDLDKAFGKEVEIPNIADVSLDNIPVDEAKNIVRAKFSQRLKTMSQNPQNWELPVEIIEQGSGFPLSDYADIARAAAAANGIDAAWGLKESQRALYNQIADQLKPSGVLGTGFDYAKKAYEKVKPPKTQDEIIGGMVSQSGYMPITGLEAFAQKPIVGAGARASFVPLTTGLRALTADYEEQQ
jgi:hypothetical protein